MFENDQAVRNTQGYLDCIVLYTTPLTAHFSADTCISNYNQQRGISQKVVDFAVGCYYKILVSFSTETIYRVDTN
jgi:hypothetical protein